MDMWTGPLVDVNVHLPLNGPGRIVDLSERLENGMARHQPPYAFSMAKTHGGVGYKNDVSVAMEMRDLEALISTEAETFGSITIPLSMGGDTGSRTCPLALIPATNGVE